MGILQPLHNPYDLSGVERGINSYFEALDRKEANKLKEKEYKAGLLQKGIVEGADGELALDDYTQQKRAADLEQEKYQLPHQKLQDQAGLLDKGMVHNEYTDQVGYSDQEQQKRALENRKLQSEIAKNYREPNAGRGGSNSPQAFGNRVIPAQQIESYSGANSAVTQLQDYQKLLEQNADIAGAGLGQNIKRGFARGTALLSGGNDVSNRTQALLASQNKVAQVIGSYLEGGKLTDTDYQKYIHMLPTVGDAPEVAKAKSAQLQNLITQRQEQQKTGYEQAGYRAESLQTAKPDTSGLGLLKHQPKGLIQNQQSNKVRVKKGSEVLEIDPADLPHAQAEGYQQVQ